MRGLRALVARPVSTFLKGPSMAGPAESRLLRRKRIHGAPQKSKQIKAWTLNRTGSKDTMKPIGKHFRPNENLNIYNKGSASHREPQEYLDRCRRNASGLIST
jgi:hypothetical protein